MSERLNTEKFILRATKKHGDLYDYSKVNYVKATQKVIIICKECSREWETLPQNHLVGKGCRSCQYKKRPKKWTEKYIISEIQKIYDINKKFPSAIYLQKNGRWDLFRAICRNGGFIYFRKIFHSSITPHGYWKINYRIEIEKIVNKLGRFPTSKELVKENNGLYDYLFRKKLLKPLQDEYNHQPMIKPIRYWNNLDNLKKWLLDNFGEMIEKRIFPTADMISAVKGGRGISTSVIRMHGGFQKVTQLMGCKPRLDFISPDGHYLDSKLELIVDWYLWSRGIEHTIHGFITKGKRYKYDFKLKNNFYVEVWGMTGRSPYDENRTKKEKLYRDLGFNLISIEANLFKNSFPCMEEKLDEIFSSFNFNVQKTQLNIELEDTISKGKGYWNFENTLQELKSVVKSINKFPSVNYLRSIGKYQIQKSMQKYGGQNKFREILGMNLIRKKVKS